MKKFFSLLVVAAIIGGVYFAGTHHIVNTRGGFKFYPKRNFSFNDSYVDMTSMSFIGLRKHMGLVSIMTRNGDLKYVPGGPALIKLSQTGMKVNEAITRFDSEYQISSSAKEVGRIGKEKYDELDRKYKIEEKTKRAQKAAENKYRELDNKYDIKGKAKQAGQKAGKAAKKLNKWLKSQ